MALGQTGRTQSFFAQEGGLRKGGACLKTYGHLWSLYLGGEHRSIPAIALEKSRLLSSEDPMIIMI